MNLRSVFNYGIMDKDSDKSIVKNGVSRHIENLRFHTNDGGDSVGHSIKGSVVVSDITDGRNDLKCVCALHRKNKNKIYYYLASVSGVFSRVAEYDIKTKNTTLVLDDNLGVLKLDYNGYITGVNIVGDLIIWTEWGNNIRRANIERAKGYGLNGFTEDDIKLICPSPYNKPKITLENTEIPNYSSPYFDGDPLLIAKGYNSKSIPQENKIKEKMFCFATRYRYLDSEYSVFSPFTLPAFEASVCEYDNATQENKSMVNAFNQVKIEFETGGKTVSEIQLVFVETNNSTVYVVDDFDKAKLNIPDNDTYTFLFNNSKTYRVLSSEILSNITPGVPRTGKSQAVIQNRLLIGNYLQDYDIKDAEINGKDIEMNYSVHVKTELITAVSSTVKSNRDLEVAVCYVDSDGRMTTLLNSKTNTAYVKPEFSMNKNSIVVNLKNKPPYFAKYFRFFIKQENRGYDNIIPSLFYADGVYRWIKIEGSDKNKVKEGDFLIVKSDTLGVKSKEVKVKVLESKLQNKNFLQPDNVVDSIKEFSGFYIKIKPDKDFSINPNDLYVYDYQLWSKAGKHSDPVVGLTPFVGTPHFYGDTLDDLNSFGTVIGSPDGYKKRYIVEIDGVNIGGKDTFRWKEVNDPTFLPQNSNLSTQTSIPFLPITLGNGYGITFDNSIGHSINDRWTLNVRGVWNVLRKTRSYGFFGLYNGDDTTPKDDTVRAGAVIQLIYKEEMRGSARWDITPSPSSRDYDNIQEWYHEENIKNEILAVSPSFNLSNIHFVKGIIGRQFNGVQITQNNQGSMFMVVSSMEHSTSIKSVFTSSTTKLTQYKDDNIVILETEPKEQPKEVYHEIGMTYKIIDGYHTSNVDGDTNQSANTDLEVTLDWFNAFSCKNGIESYKIKDSFNANGLNLGVRTLTSLSSKYKESKRINDITWSGVVEDDFNFNGLSDFNMALGNNVAVGVSYGSIQSLQNVGDNLVVIQEDVIGRMPYNKSIIYDAVGNENVGISRNVLEEKGYVPYNLGDSGVSLNPESVLNIGGKIYCVHRDGGNFLRLSNSGVDSVNSNGMEHEFSNLMIANPESKFVTGYDPKHKEVLISIPSTEKTLIWKEGKGFSEYLGFSPDFMLGADNEFYAWKNGVMHVMNSSEYRNLFFGDRSDSVIRFFENTESYTKKVLHALSIESNKAWDVHVKTSLTSRDIPKESFIKKEGEFYSEVMGNTNGEIESSNVLGLGTYSIVNGEIDTVLIPSTLSIGDKIKSGSESFGFNEIMDIQGKKIILKNKISVDSSFLIYYKNQNVDGSSIRGNVFDVEMRYTGMDKVELKAVNFEVSVSKV